MGFFRELTKFFRRKKPVQIDELQFWHQCMLDVERGKRKDPLDMTPQERHDATRKIAKKMKWSPTFVQAMTLPLALRALEAGGEIRDPLTDSNFSLDDHDDFARVKHMTRQDFIEDNAAWKAAPLFTAPTVSSEEL